MTNIEQRKYDVAEAVEDAYLDLTRLIKMALLSMRDDEIEDAEAFARETRRDVADMIRSLSRSKTYLN